MHPDITKMLDEIEETLCPECHGSGFVEHDCFEDSCCCLNPEDEPCPLCHGEGEIERRMA